MTEPWPALQRKDVDRVLRRAIELEHRGGEWMEGAQLREIARELDLDPRSVELALRELALTPDASDGTAPAPAAPRGERTAAVVVYRVATVFAYGGPGLGFVALLVAAALDLVGAHAASARVMYVCVWLLVGGLLIGIVLLAVAVALRILFPPAGVRRR